MVPLATRSPILVRWLLVLAEIGLVFVVFALYGAWPVPDVNEVHYLGKAVHFWNPEWAKGDFFLDSTDAHWVFYYGFGWLSLWLSPVALAWTGRVATWWLLAWSWRRLSWAALPRRWWSVATAAIALLLIDRFQMAGEWMVGGVEAKGFAYVLVLLGLECLLRDRWNRTWLCFGGASMIHVIVGGWAVVAAGLAWFLLGPDRRPTLRSMTPGLLGGFAISLPGLIPALLLGWGVDASVASRANEIYVFARLPHHLNPARFPAHVLLRFAAMLFVWALVRWKTSEKQPVWRLHCFVAGSIALCMAGIVICHALAGQPDRAAALLRFYWFRLSDIAVPIGLALGTPVLIEQLRPLRPSLARAAGVLFAVLALGFVGWNAGELVAGREIRVMPAERIGFADWRDACRWIASSGEIPDDAVFLTPRLSRTFKWYANRAEVVNWKDIPQDAASIVEWWDRNGWVHATGSEDADRRWFDSLAEQGEYRLVLLGRHYKASYVLTVTEPRLNLPVVYENNSFIVYQLE